MTGPATPPTEADLLAHAGFVRVLARTLVAGEAEADDLSQDAWLAALRSPPAESTNLKGWFARVLRNLARMRHRTDRRRLARETVAAKPGRAPAADETAARLEIQRRLVEAVTSLDEPFRTALVLRYFDGLRPVEVARRQGIPANTVHSRISRALDRLRDRLDRVHGGDRSAWRASLLPLAGLAAGARAATGAALLMGGLAVSTKVKVGLVAAALVVSAVAVWQSVTPEPVPNGTPEEADAQRPPPLRASAADTEESVPDDQPREEGARVAAEPAAEPPALGPAKESETWRVVARVLDHEGAPASGARLTFTNDTQLKSDKRMLETHLRGIEGVIDLVSLPDDRAKLEKKRAELQRQLAEIDARRARVEAIADGGGRAALDVPGAGWLAAERYGGTGGASIPEPPWSGDHEVEIRLRAPDRFGPQAPAAQYSAGAGGVLGGRGGHRNLRAHGGSKATEDAVALGLDWLMENQSPDGGWSAGAGPSDTAVTGLALLAFLGGGNTHVHGKYKDAVGDGLARLLATQDGSGGIGASVGKENVNHAIATQALAEAWALTGMKELGEGAQRAIEYLVAMVIHGEATAEETVWAACALISARAGKLEVPESALDRTRDRLAAVLDEAGRKDTALVGGAWFCRASLLPGSADSIEHRRALKSLLSARPRWGRRGSGADYPTWYFASLALFQQGVKYWKRWNEPLKDALTGHQVSDGDEKGSWDPHGPQADVLGRAGITALAVSTLEVYYRYARPTK